MTKINISKTSLGVEKGDITTYQTDAIVNAANRFLLEGGGVSGAIHRAAGPELVEECRQLEGCEPGEAKITQGHNLPAGRVIHTVGPVYGNESGREAEILADCYKNSLQLAVDNEIETIAFPSISTGAFGYPVSEASKIAISAIKEFLKENNPPIKEITLVTFSDEDFEAYKEAILKAREDGQQM